jgi:hypothetical protein
MNTFPRSFNAFCSSRTFFWLHEAASVPISVASWLSEFARCGPVARSAREIDCRTEEIFSAVKHFDRSS